MTPAHKKNQIYKAGFARKLVQAYFLFSLAENKK